MRVEDALGTYDISIASGSDGSNPVVQILGRLKRNAIPDSGLIDYIAAAPVDSRLSFAGSGLPFSSKEQALYQTPNTGRVKCDRSNGSFVIYLTLPGSYYVGLGSVLVPPTVFLTMEAKRVQLVTHIVVAPPVAFRMSTYPAQFVLARDSPLFYLAEDVIPPRTQEQILRDSGYPTTPAQAMPYDFWGKCPPV